MENEQSVRIINRHYIGVIKEIEGSLKYVQIDIPQDNILIEEIDAMKDNENRTLMDVQQHFMEAYPKDSYYCRYYDYLYPGDYTDAFVCGANYPHIVTFDEYKKRLAEHEKWIKDCYIKDLEEVKNELGNLKKESVEKYDARVKEIIERKMKEYVDNWRRNFDYKRFLYAENYTVLLNDIKQDPSVKMYSTDQIGWKEFEYKANDDITVYIKSNFGYGSASYFFCNLKFKDINILPYTAVIKYYYVQMIDFIRYTRRYATNRDSWNEIFDFAVETGNLAKNEPDRFIKEWIINEVEEMMVGIRKIMSSPKEELEKFLGFMRKSGFSLYKNIDNIWAAHIFRNCKTQDVKDYEVLPNEKVIAFKAEKITGCLLLLDNLRKLTEITNVITPYVEEIELMNLRIQPEIASHVESLAKDINRLNTDLNDIKKEIMILEPTLERHKKAIEEVRKEMNKIANEGKKNINIEYGTYEAEQKYRTFNPEYVKFKEKYDELNTRKGKLKKRIERRERFLEILNKCLKRIKKNLNADRLTEKIILCEHGPTPLKTKGIDVALGTIIEGSVVHTDKNYIIIKSENEQTAYIHRSMWGEYSMSRFNKGQMVRVEKIGFDNKHNKPVWKILSVFYAL